ncbi:MAG: hypothetical protein C4310_04285 [Chloroflexota bacterium]
MLTHRRAVLSLSLLVLFALVIAACGPQATPAPPATVIVTVPVERTVIVQPTAPPPTQPPPAGPKTLVVCMAQEPDTLYNLGGSMLASTAVQHAFRDFPITSLTYAYQPVIIEKLPSLKDGDATLTEVEVKEGDTVADAMGNVITLTVGAQLKDKDGNVFKYTGGMVKLPQLSATFKLKEGLKWEDGQPLTADDSVFGFELGKSPDTPVSKFAYDRTASYVAQDDRTIVWTGIPGWLDATYYINIFTPHPRHIYGNKTPAELLQDESMNRKPIGYGPFKMVEWVQGDHITLEKNPNYWRAAEGLPKFDRVVFRFIKDTNQLIAQLLAGECDIGTQDAAFDSQAPFLKQAEQQGLIKPVFVLGTSFEHLDFNITPAETYKGFAANGAFADKRIRQAFAYCIDRKAIIDQVLFGESVAPNVYLPKEHPLYAGDENLTIYNFDPEKGKALLAEAGWTDTDGDGIVDKNGQPFHVTYGTTAGNRLREQVTQIIQAQLKENCGISVELYYKPAREWFADGPEGPLFGRAYDLGEFAWLTGVEPPCDLYITSQIPNEVNGWGASNNAGYSNPEYDAACQQQLGTIDPDKKAKFAKQAQIIFSQDLPVLPLFLRLKIAAHRPDLVNFKMDPTENSEMWNIEELDLAP